jgi:hypothetical protein
VLHHLAHASVLVIPVGTCVNSYQHSSYQHLRTQVRAFKLQEEHQLFGNFASVSSTAVAIAVKQTQRARNEFSNCSHQGLVRKSVLLPLLHKIKIRILLAAATSASRSSPQPEKEVRYEQPSDQKRCYPLSSHELCISLQVHHHR